MRPHSKLNVLEVDMVSFTEAFLLLAREGGAKILNTLYRIVKMLIVQINATLHSISTDKYRSLYDLVKR